MNILCYQQKRIFTECCNFLNIFFRPYIFLHCIFYIVYVQQNSVFENIISIILTSMYLKQSLRLQVGSEINRYMYMVHVVYNSFQPILFNIHSIILIQISYSTHISLCQMRFLQSIRHIMVALIFFHMQFFLASCTHRSSSRTFGLLTMFYSIIYRGVQKVRRPKVHDQSLCITVIFHV